MRCMGLGSPPGPFSYFICILHSIRKLAEDERFSLFLWLSVHPHPLRCISTPHSTNEETLAERKGCTVKDPRWLKVLSHTL